MSVKTRVKEAVYVPAVGESVELVSWPTDLRTGEVEDVMDGGTRTMARVRLTGPAGHPHAGSLTIVPVEALRPGVHRCPTCGQVTG